MLSRKHPFQCWSLQRLLLLASIVQIAITALIVGGLSYRTNQQTYTRALASLQSSYLEQTRKSILIYIHTAHKSSEITAALTHNQRIGYTESADLIPALETLWDVAGRFPHIGTLAWSTADGAFVGVNRQEDYIVYTPFHGETRVSRELLRRRARPGAWMTGSILSRSAGYDPRKRSWYQRAAETGRPVWSKVNFSVAAQRLDATNAVPVYRTGRSQLLGVAMTDLSLNQLSREMRSDSVFPKGTAVLLDRNRRIVASTAVDQPYLSVQGQLQRLTLENSTHPLLSELGEHLQAYPSPAGERPDLPVMINTESQGKAVVISAPMEKQALLDMQPPPWSLLLVLPQAHYLEPLRQSLFRILFFTALIILASGALAFLFTRHLLQPLRSLHQTAQALTHGRWISTESSTRQDEIGHLSRTFVNMTSQIRESLRQLREENQERRRTEEKLSRSLSEKEVLLKEIHHRVKNNMQIIVSLINLEKDDAEKEDPESLTAILDDLSSRITAMAAVHEKLYGSSDLTHIQVEDFIPDLVEEMSALYSAQLAQIHREYRIDPLSIDIDKAIPLGLLINEIVSNSIKHAFHPQLGGKILFQSFREGNQFHLIIQDTGPGFDWEEARQKDSLGMILIDALTGQMGGDLEIAASEGSQYHLTIPISPPAEPGE